MIVIVFAAFFASGGLKAGTPLAIASTPVRATEPAANARRMQDDAQRLRAEGHQLVGGRLGHGALAGRDPDDPQADDHEGEPNEQVGRDGEDVARLAEAAQVGDRDEGDRRERDLDPQVVQGRDRRSRPGRRRRPSRRRPS